MKRFIFDKKQYGNQTIFEKLVVTKRRFVIRQTPSVKQTACAECGSPVLTIAQAAIFFGIKQSRIFQVIETEAAHFTETEAGAVMICLNSLANHFSFVGLTVSNDDCDGQEKQERKLSFLL